MTPTGQRQPRYPTEMMELVCQMAQGGFTPHRIQGKLRAAGLPVPSRDTLKRWTDADYDEVMHDRRRIGYAGRVTGPVGKRGWGRRLERLRVLRSCGVSYFALANIARQDFSLELTEDQVRGILKGATSEERTRQLLSAKDTSTRKRTV